MYRQPAGRSAGIDGPLIFFADSSLGRSRWSRPVSRLALRRACGFVLQDLGLLADQQGLTFFLQSGCALRTQPSLINLSGGAHHE
jgi:hypothetical protein